MALNKKTTIQLGYKNNVNLDLSNEGIIEIKSLDRKIMGLSYHHKIKIKDNNEKIIDDVAIDFKYNLGQTFCSKLLNQNIYSRVVGRNTPYMSVYKVKYSFENPYIETMDKIKEICNEYNGCFNFLDFVKIEKNNLIVEFKGHEVAGSYTPEREVVSSYIEKIKSKTPKRVKFIERKCAGFGFDIYVFSINLKSNLKAPN